MNSPDDSLDDPRVMQIAHEYLADLEAGRAPDRGVYLGRCPEIAAELAECLDGIAFAHGGLRPVAPAPPEPMLGTLGDFRIVREVGRGGMGVVYEAIQISLNRAVALKVLPFAAALDERQLQRFRNEAQAAAGLHHSHIVPVFHVGCERGVHFYAMQLINGRPLDAVIRGMRGESGRGAGGTTVDHVAVPTAVAPASVRTSARSGREGFRSAARLAADVADALDYAHQAGVVHRDIKPGNLLLDGKGVIWVADFGLAHVHDVSLTRTGDVVGTLRYMAPEQAQGARVLVDHRADIYSLGATVYELLTLHPMFPAQERAALLRQILDDEPAPPRLIDRAIPIDLETIVLKAVAKDPADRYASAADMAADLRRFLNAEPIRARRPSLAERARKWLWRHPSFVTAAVLVLAFSTAVLAVAVALVSREQSRTQTAYAAERLRAKEAEDNLQLAERNFRLAERTVDDLVQVAKEELRDRPDPESVRKQLLKMALAYHEEFIESHKDDPDAQARLAKNRDSVRDILTDLIDKEGARRADLLRDNSVLDDLKLSSQEREEVNRLNKRLKELREETFKGFAGLNADERDRRFLAMARAMDADVEEVLAPQHVRRLRQIEVQKQGPDAFRRPEVAAALKLTVAQRSQVRSAIADPFAGKPDPQGHPWVVWQAKRKATGERIAALLTAEQAALWKAMTGEPYKEPSQGFPFGGRGKHDKGKGPPPGERK